MRIYSYTQIINFWIIRIETQTFENVHTLMLFWNVERQISFRSILFPLGSEFINLISVSKIKEMFRLAVVKNYISILYSINEAMLW